MKISLIISLIIPILILIFGDSLYIGIWYYFLIPLIFIASSSYFKLKSSFYAGVSLAICISFLFYLSINWNAINTESQLVVLHLLGLPGSFVLMMLSPLLVNKINHFILGFFSFIFGFILSEFIFCTILYNMNFTTFLEMFVKLVSN